MTRLTADGFETLQCDTSAHLASHKKRKYEDEPYWTRVRLSKLTKNVVALFFPSTYQPVLRGTPASETGIAAALGPVDAVEASGGWCLRIHASLHERSQCDTKM